MSYEDEIFNEDYDVPEDETTQGRRRTRVARAARRHLTNARMTLETVLEDYDVKNTQCLLTDEDARDPDAAIDGLSASEIAALTVAHRVITTKIAELTSYLKDRA